MVDQRPEDFGIGRLFWLTHEAIVGAALETAQIVLWNPAAERLFGYSADEAIGMRLEALVPPDHRAQHLAGVARYIATRQGMLVGGHPVAVPALRRGGELFDVTLTLTDVSEVDGRAHVLAIIRDTTEIKASQRTLERTNEAMREFVATASHDLRTPLSSVIGFAETLAHHPDQLGDGDQEVCIDGIVRNAHRAARLVDDLLTLSQIQATAITAHLAEVPLAAAARSAASDAGVGVSVEVDEDLHVLVDADHLHRMLVNYLSNAARHGRPPIVARGAVVDGRVEVTISDAGDGVPSAFRERLFTSFARAQQSSAGTGLGLSIVRGLASANGGEAFHQDDAPGATFGLRLQALVKGRS